MAWIHRYTRYGPDYDSHISLNRVNWLCMTVLLIYSWRIHTVMSWINFVLIFSSGLEIFSTFNTRHPVYGCTIHVLLIVNHRFCLSSTSSWQKPSSGEKCNLIFKKLIKKTRQPFYIGHDYNYTWVWYIYVLNSKWFVGSLYL